MRGKTRPSKHELAAQKVGLNFTTPDELVKFLASAFINANCKGVNINGLSNSMTIDAVYAITGIQLIPSNLAHYKLRNVDLTLQVAKQLNIPVLRFAHCDISYKDQILLIRPCKNGASDAFHLLLHTATGKSIKSLYEIWQYQGKSVGDKRYWVHSDVVVWCQQNNINPMIPISHDNPKALSRVFKYFKALIKNEIITHTAVLKLNDWINESLLAYCNSDLPSPPKRKRKWLQDHSTLPEIHYVNRVEADSRRPPYQYCRLQDGLSKFGKCENGARFKNSDVGLVICIDHHEVQTAYRVEQQVIAKLKERNIHLKDGKLEHFEVPLQHLCNVILDIYAMTPEFSSIVRSIVATTKYVK
ncbi:MAG: hypothetical protein ACI936_001153 [Paraglaciecola sp.]|jgi:hypothetical protein